MLSRDAHAHPSAVLSRSALERGVQRATAAGGAVADLRGDAWGHGLREVALYLVPRGVTAVRVDDDAAVAQLADLPLSASVSVAPDFDAQLLFGLPGAGSADDPVMELRGRVLSTKRLQPGDAVSYGYTFRAERATTVALVTGGYAHGIVRTLGNHATVFVAGQLLPIVGRVAMDVCVIDLGEHELAPGAEVTYFGGTHASALSTWSAVSGFTPAELVAVAGAKAVRTWTD